MAEIAAIRGHPRLMRIQRRLMIGEIVMIGGGGQTPRHHAGRKLAVGHDGPPFGFLFPKGCHRRIFLSNGKFIDPDNFSTRLQDAEGRHVKPVLSSPGPVAYKRKQPWRDPAGTG
jgi:hypothetical protein